MTSVHNPSAVAVALSCNVRASRLAARLTLEALAKRAGISKGMLVQVEHGRTNPSLDTLWRLSRALDVALPELLEVPSPSARVMRRCDGLVLWNGRRGGQGRVLAASGEHGPLELWEFRMGPSEAYRATAQSPGTVEMVHVLTGRLSLTVGDERVEAAQGDTVVFRPEREHEYRNAGSGRLHLVLANVERAGRKATERAVPRRQRPTSGRTGGRRDER